MKKLPFLLLLCLPLLACTQTTYKGLPVIRAASDQADYRIGTEWVRGNWRISPQISPDVLPVTCFSGPEQLVFRTDLDSLKLTVKPGQRQQFYVLLNDNAYALTELQGVTYTPAVFEAESAKPEYAIRYENNPDSEFLRQLRQQYALEEVVAEAKNDTEKALRIVNWVHRQWKHNGNNQPARNDALTILSEAREGKQFRCVEYGIVTAAALNSIGLKSRVLALKTQDVETSQGGAGHVVMETWLPDLNKWVMLDGQWDAMPVLQGRPLNAVELQQAIASRYDELEIRSLSGTGKRGYASWIMPYLYYFDFPFDNREGAGLKKELVDGKSSLMLVPKGAKNPAVFQVKWPINSMYTHSLADFYAKPD